MLVILHLYNCAERYNSFWLWLCMFKNVVKMLDKCLWYSKYCAKLKRKSFNKWTNLMLMFDKTFKTGNGNFLHFYKMKNCLPPKPANINFSIWILTLYYTFFFFILELLSFRFLFLTLIFTLIQIIIVFLAQPQDYATVHFTAHIAWAYIMIHMLQNMFVLHLINTAVSICV